MFEYEWKCVWGHVDPHGIAYYPRLIMSMHQAGEEFMDELGIAYWDLHEEYNVSFPIVAVETEFKKPVEVGDVLTFTVDPDPGTKSLGMKMEATHDDGTLAFSGHEQHVCVRLDDNEPVEIPEEIRATIEDAPV